MKSISDRSTRSFSRSSFHTLIFALLGLFLLSGAVPSSMGVTLKITEAMAALQERYTFVCGTNAVWANASIPTYPSNGIVGTIVTNTTELNSVVQDMADKLAVLSGRYSPDKDLDGKAAASANIGIPHYYIGTDGDAQAVFCFSGPPYL